MKLKIGHFQCTSKPEDFEANLATIIRGLENATDENISVLSFPETFLDGYFDTQDKIRANAYNLDDPKIKRLLSTTSKFPIMFMVGFFELRNNSVYNTIIVCEKGNNNRLLQ